IDYTKPAYFRKGNDQQMNQFVTDLQAGRVGGVIFYNCNPVYDFARGREVAEGIAKAKVSVSTSITKDETASLVQFLAPDHHFLESWNDFNPRSGEYSLSQPTISPLFNTRQAQDSFLRWAGVSTEYYDFLQKNWTTGLFANQTDVATFQELWNRALYSGVYTTGAATVAVDSDSTGVAASLAASPAAITAVIDASAAASAVV